MTPGADGRAAWIEDVTALLEAPRELAVIYVAKFIEMLSYFSMVWTLTLWLSKDWGMSDVEAGWWSGTFSTVITVLTFFVGFVADSIGFREVLIFGAVANCLSRGVMFLAPSRVVAIVGLMALTAGTAAGAPVLSVAIRRYTNRRNRKYGFALYYVIMNAGALVAGFFVDWVRGWFRSADGKTLVTHVVSLPLVGPREMSAYKAVFGLGFLMYIVSVAVLSLLRKGTDVERDEVTAVLASSSPGAPAPVDAEKKNPFAIAADVVRQTAFWRFTLFIGLLLMVRLIFQHINFTWPKYASREFGESFPWGKYMSINPLLIMFFVPVATVLTRRRSPFACILLGSFVTAGSVFFLCLPPGFVQIGGWGRLEWTNTAFLTIESVGEALWSPRFMEYAATIAPRGRESSYMGLSALPTFIAKMIVGPMSGYLLRAYCPETGPRHPQTMWFIIGAVTLAGPVLVVMLRRFIVADATPSPSTAASSSSAALDG